MTSCRARHATTGCDRPFGIVPVHLLSKQVGRLHTRQRSNAVQLQCALIGVFNETPWATFTNGSVARPSQAHLVSTAKECQSIHVPAAKLSPLCPMLQSRITLSLLQLSQHSSRFILHVGYKWSDLQFMPEMDEQSAHVIGPHAAPLRVY